jgi:hypothetical protein
MPPWDRSQKKIIATILPFLRGDADRQRGVFEEGKSGKVWKRRRVLKSPKLKILMVLLFESSLKGSNMIAQGKRAERMPPWDRS